MEKMELAIDDLQLITGIDIPIPELGITLRQPRINDISILGETLYFLALSLVTITPEDIKNKGKEVPSNWDLFNEALRQKIDGVPNVRGLVSNFLQLFLVEKINIGPRSLLIVTEQGVSNIEPQDFEIFQSLISSIGGGFLLKKKGAEFNPGSKRAAEIAAKMQRARAKIAAMQPKKKDTGFLVKYIRSLGIVTANTLEQINNMTLFQIDSLMKSYNAWEEYDLEIRTRLAGGKGDNKIEHWMAKEDSLDKDSPYTV